MGQKSAIATVMVRPTTTFTLNDATARRNQTVYFTGHVTPTSKSQVVYLQRYSAGIWRSVKSQRLSSTSRFRFAWRPDSHADYAFRVYVPARLGYLAAPTVTRRLTVL